MCCPIAATRKGCKEYEFVGNCAGNLGLCATGEPRERKVKKAHIAVSRLFSGAWELWMAYFGA
jgi:hypothetical protein